MAKKLATIPLNFGGLSGKQCQWEHSRVVLIPVPYDLTTSYLSGSRRGPLAILEASTHMELFDEELGSDTSRIGIHTLPPLEAVASGPRAMVAQIQSYAEKVMRAGKFPVLIGGEHTVSLGMARAIKGKYPAVSFLQLDAHADLRNSFEGTSWSHACVGRRLTELGPLVQVGLRSLSREENSFLKKGKVTSFFWHRFPDTPDWVERVCRALSPEVYVTIDLDVLDPAIMPSVGTPEPGGFHWPDLIQFLRRIAREKTVVGFDVVELAPLPGWVAPDFLAAKLIYRLLGAIFARSPGQRKIPRRRKGE